jgi:hypothetical protein
MGFDCRRGEVLVVSVLWKAGVRHPLFPLAPIICTWPAKSPNDRQAHVQLQKLAEGKPLEDSKPN